MTSAILTVWRTHSCVQRSHSPETLERRQSVHHGRVVTNTSREIHWARWQDRSGFLALETAPQGVACRSCERVFATGPDCPSPQLVTSGSTNIGEDGCE